MSRNHKRPPATVLPIDLIDLWQQVLMTQQNRSTEIMSIPASIDIAVIVLLPLVLIDSVNERLLVVETISVQTCTSEFGLIRNLFRIRLFHRCSLLSLFESHFVCNAGEIGSDILHQHLRVLSKRFSFSAGFYPQQLTVYFKKNNKIIENTNEDLLGTNVGRKS